MKTLNHTEMKDVNGGAWFGLDQLPIWESVKQVADKFQQNLTVVWTALGNLWQG